VRADDDTEDTLSETPDAPTTEQLAPGDTAGAATTSTPDDRTSKSTPLPSSRRGRGASKSTPARRGSTRPARDSPSSTSQADSASSGNEGAGSLAAALRGLVGGIGDEVSAITSLSGEIDGHVSALNDLRAEATRRLLHLDDLRGAAEDVNLSAFLDTSIQPQLPQVEEDFPDRIYGG
jgi:hypothetical protein